MKNYTHLEDKIKSSYETGVTVEEAEKLAAEFLYAQLTISTELSLVDLDARMKKSGLKSIKSAVRQEEIKKHDKKPTEGHLEDVVNLDEIVQGEQERLDQAEVNRALLEAYYNVFKDAHIYYRGIAKGNFNG